MDRERLSAIDRYEGTHGCIMDRDKGPGRYDSVAGSQRLGRYQRIGRYKGAHRYRSISGHRKDLPVSGYRQIR